ncbi:MAG: 4-(cytidine 5'-diphospho)-2-C-methyl-D-erythritol kinase [Candidatus Acetothermia bacterium]
MEISVKAFAKVNPYLKIISRERDGYHNLKLSFLSIDLADRITFTPLEQENRIEVSMDGDVPQEENLVYKVANELSQRCAVDDRGTRIVVNKRIPIGAGLGGGSTDAAATLVVLNRLWGCGLRRESLMEIGEKYGSDITFFFHGGFCRGQGRGTEVKKEQNPFGNRFVPVIAPAFSQMTAAAYKKYDEYSDGGEESSREVDGLEILNPGNVGGFKINNDLQKPVIEINPDLEDYIRLLEACPSIQTAGLTGSGSAVFGIAHEGVPKFDLMEEIGDLPPGARLFFTKPTSSGHELTEVWW